MYEERTGDQQEVASYDRGSIRTQWQMLLCKSTPDLENV
jgi:hypothetical protein